MRVARSCRPSARSSEFDQLFAPFFAQPENAAGWSAPVAIWNDEQNSYVEIEMPGVVKEDLNVEIENGQLTVTAERKAPEGERNYAYNDRRFGKFTRAFKLPDTIDPESISAELSAGVLKLSLRRRPELQPKKVQVQAS